MSFTRRVALCTLLAPIAPANPAQQQEPPDIRRPLPDRDRDEDIHLPNGKSQKDAISKQAHADALKEVESLLHVAEDLRDELKHFGEHVVSVSSIKKTEEIEKLARQIRGKLKG